MASSQAGEVAFSLERVAGLFAASRLVNEDGSVEIDTHKFLEAYGELNRVFDLLGKGFSFVTSDVTDKISILRTHLEHDSASYVTIHRMIAHELQREDIRQKTKPASGSRTLLRLHRALEFIALFFQRIAESDPAYSIGNILSESYSETLAKHHPWMVRQAVNLATYAAPARKDLLTKLGLDESTAKVQLLLVVQHVTPLHLEVESLYTRHALHDLP